MDNGDKLNSVTWSGEGKTYGYDAAGRTTSVVTGAGTTSLAYDYEGRVTTITYPGSSTNTFTYNGLDTRVGKVDSGGTKTFFRSGVGVTDPVLSDSAANYTPGVSERRGSTTTFSHSGVKNADLQTSTSQVSTATRNYDAFGNVVASSGTWSGPFGYAGKFGYQEDSESGLKLLGHRYYDSSTGRFITRDPAKAGRNWYGYCKNSPLVAIDPTGNETIYGGFGIGGCSPFLSASLKLLLVYDYESSHLGIEIVPGIGLGAGAPIAGIPEPGFVIGHSKHQRVKTDLGIKPAMNGITASGVDFAFDSEFSDWEIGYNTHGENEGFAYHEKRWSLMIDLDGRAEPRGQIEIGAHWRGSGGNKVFD